MRKILFTIFILLSLNGNAQNKTNKIYYSASKMDVLIKKSEDDMTRNPWAINVLITYDKYFKSLSISYTDEKNKKNLLEFYFVEVIDEPDDDQEPFIHMRTKKDESVWVTNRLQINGSLQITLDDMKSIIVIENAKKITRK